MTFLAVNPKIEPSWKAILKGEFQQDYFADLKQFLLKEKKRGSIVYPPGRFIFNAFNLCPFDEVKVVILGQDPYHGPGQAHGLCFSVSKGIAFPPSLVNIFQELSNDLKIPFAKTGSLKKWAEQGVLLLNSILTVRAGQPLSHANRGWELFTDAVIGHINRAKKGVIFLLWGRPAQAKGRIIDSFKHHVLKAPHSSPFSASSGFFGCRHFSKTNKLLRQMGKPPIDWQLD